MSETIDLSLVVACYNEEPILVESIKETVAILDATPWNYEMIFVDDCSQDNTRVIIESLIDIYHDKNFLKLFHERNMGRGGTVTDGIRMAKGKIAGYIDIDLEVHARYIPSMVIAIQQGADIATAHRVYKVQPRLFIRYLLSQGYAHLMRAMLDVHLQDTETGYKFFNRQRILPILDEIEDQRWFWDTEVMVRSLERGYNIVEIPTLFVRRYDKVSTVNEIQDSLDYFKNLWRFRKELQASRRAKSGMVPSSKTPEKSLDIK